MVDNSDFLDPDGFSGDIRRDTLRDRIERIIETHTLINGADECTCGVLWEIQDGFHSTDGSTCYDNHLAGVIADFVTDEKREPAVPENKSLRDRIIAAIAGADRDWNSDYPDMADAVIAELGLKRVEMGEWDVLAQGFRGYRYVTPWDVDDE